MDCSLPGSSIHGIFQARVLEWVAIAFSLLSHVRLFMTRWTVARQAPLSMECSRQEYWSGLGDNLPAVAGDIVDLGLIPGLIYSMVCRRPKSCDVLWALMSVTSNLCCDETEPKRIHSPDNLNAPAMSALFNASSLDWSPTSHKKLKKKKRALQENMWKEGFTDGTSGFKVEFFFPFGFCPLKMRHPAQDAADGWVVLYLSGFLCLLRRYRWEPQLELGNKNSLAFASDIGSLVVTGRFCDLGITKGDHDVSFGTTVGISGNNDESTNWILKLWKMTNDIRAVNCSASKQLVQ
ncbi:hypothetical protein MG293_000178 [Ovis ammon polii]|uniref:Uncharacterized protein n=1 Tax=Ovis ammon polii TaxID=230172 RepID=A0AAD4UII6_OVIAM|nr:hypothetical protein MG293_000178 [Ovis ammon polii]